MAKSVIQGFSKLSQSEKIELLSKQFELNELEQDMKMYLHPSKQKLFNSFSENTLSNYYLPYSIAPNFLINGEVFHIPMVVEESSVVAAASAAAVFWSKHGGFRAKVTSTIKSGQIHFTWKGDKTWLLANSKEICIQLKSSVIPLVENMEKRGGGIFRMELLDKTDILPDFFQIFVDFNTVDSMGANFINSVLEEMASTLKTLISSKYSIKGECDIVMSILSNYTPECLVEVKVEAPLEIFAGISEELSAAEFAQKLNLAVQVANQDIYRAVTHNKGIMNGIDAVVLATGNDFRAVEANAHAFASRKGGYSSLSEVLASGEMFSLKIIIPLALGTVGGLTTLHPLAKKSMEILGNPGAEQLMMIAASVGLANHFSALKALVTSGIQKGHMKMHLNNILAQLFATEKQREAAEKWFSGKTVSVSAVRNFLNKN